MKTVKRLAVPRLRSRCSRWQPPHASGSNAIASDMPSSRRMEVNNVTTLKRVVIAALPVLVLVATLAPRLKV